MHVVHDSRASMKWWLLGILAVAWAIRITLALRGGQMFWLDESFRWYPGQQIADAFRYHHDPHEALMVIVKQSSQHIGFLIFSVPAALLFEISGRSPMAMGMTTAVLGLASVWVIAIVYGLARRMGADVEEALLAAALTAATACLTVYARHILPYDASLALALTALWLALDPRTSWIRSIFVGLGAGIALLVYYGNQSLVATVLAVHVLAGKHRPIRVLGSVGGVLIPLLGLQVLTVAAGGPAFLDQFWAHQVGNGPHTIVDVQGDLAEGWLLPFRYFWASEHGLAFVWLLALVVTPFLIGRVPRLRWWFGIVIVLYGQLALWSTGFGVAAALGRLARPIAPFLCLLTAGVLRNAPRQRGYVILGILALVGQASWNLTIPFQQVWPSQLHKEIGAPRSVLSVRGPEEAGVTACNTGDSTARGLVLVNTCTWLYPIRDVYPPIMGQTLRTWAHPLQYVPYQYEVLNPEMRAVAARADLSMRLVDQGRGGN